MKATETRGERGKATHTQRETEIETEREKRKWGKERSGESERRKEAAGQPRPGVNRFLPGDINRPLRMDGSVIRSADREGQDRWTRAAADRRQ